MKKITIIGSNFAGFTAALELKEKLENEAEITVISKSEEFLFMPSLIWVPFGLRDKEDITFPLAPVYKKKGIQFINSEVKEIKLGSKEVVTTEKTISYDYLIIATGPKLNYAAVPGLGPDNGYTQSIFGWDAAYKAHLAFDKFLEDPGPVIIGAVQGASCFGAAYEFLLNFTYQIKKRNLKDKVKITYVTAEPFLGHFGIGGFGNAEKMVKKFFDYVGVEYKVNKAVKEIQKDKMIFTDGEELPFKYSMMAPAFLGVDAVRNLKEITNEGGWVIVDENYRTLKYPEVYAAGVAVAVAPPQKTEIPCGVPKTGYLSEEMAKVAVHNIVSDIHGHPLVSLPPAMIDAKCVLDAGNMGIIMSSDHFLEPRKHEWLIPGPEAHWAKLAFEKYFLFTRKRGWV